MVTNKNVISEGQNGITAKTAPQEVASTPVKAETPKAKQKPAQKKEKQPAVDGSGFCVYLGPSIRGAFNSGTIFDTDRDTTLTVIKSTLEKYPLVADLIVSGDLLAESRIKVKKPGNLLYANYIRLALQLKK